jgi:hypothetical protein
MNKLVLSTGIAVAGLLAAGLGFASVATAAPADPSPASTAPTSAGPAPVPVPVVYRPVDASDGLYGMRRGSVPTASTRDLSRVPIANRLPVIDVTPLPANADDTTDETATDAADAGASDSGVDGSTAQ